MMANADCYHVPNISDNFGRNIVVNNKATVRKGKYDSRNMMKHSSDDFWSNESQVYHR